MRKQILAGAVVLALAATVTTSAMASDHKDGRSGVGHVHSGAMHSFRAKHGSRFAGVRGFESARHGAWDGGNAYDHGGFVSLGPLGITARCGQRGTCGQGYSVSAWSY
jgi:nucleoside-specific outer membrane channel protein Tsx